MLRPPGRAPFRMQVCRPPSSGPEGLPPSLSSGQKGPQVLNPGDWPLPSFPSKCLRRTGRPSQIPWWHRPAWWAGNRIGIFFPLFFKHYLLNGNLFPVLRNLFLFFFFSLFCTRCHSPSSSGSWLLVTTAYEGDVLPFPFLNFRSSGGERKEGRKDTASNLSLKSTGCSGHNLKFSAHFKGSLVVMVSDIWSLSR